MSLCIEVKLLRAGRKSKVIEEISADITAYKKMYPHQLFVVYDLGEIQNETEFKTRYRDDRWCESHYYKALIHSES